MASGRFADTFIGNENEWARSFVQFGRNTSSAAPQAAPASDPSPPTTTPASRYSESWIVNAPG